MVDETDLTYVHRRRAPSEDELEPAQRRVALTRLESVGDAAALHEMGSTGELPPVAGEPGGEPTRWLTHEQLRERLKVSSETFYRMVVSGDIVWSLTDRGLQYTTVNPLASYFDGHTPSDTSELAKRRPPRVAVVGQLAARIDVLTRRLADSERRRRLAETARDDAIRLLREATDERTALMEQHVAIRQRLRELEPPMAGPLDARAPSRAGPWVAESRRLRAALDDLLAALDQLAQSPMALPIRTRLNRIRAGWERGAPDDEP